MNDSRIALKVGLFVAVGLALLAGLMLNFSKGITLGKTTYKFHITLPTVAGLKPNADVMMSGVQIGKVVNTKLNEDGKSVNITVSVLAEYKIHKDAAIRIDAMGFLGDQYIEISPTKNEGPLIQPDEMVQGESPMNLQEAVKSVSGLLDDAKTTIRNLNLALTNINKTVLTEKSLNGFTLAISNFEAVAETANTVIRQVEVIIGTNGTAISDAITNLHVFSAKLNVVADDVHGLISTNQADITAAVKNLRDVSTKFQQLADDLQAGKGLAGGLLKDESMKTNLSMVLTNASEMTANISMLASNINHKGLWHILWSQKEPATNNHK